MLFVGPGPGKCGTLINETINILLGADPAVTYSIVPELNGSKSSHAKAIRLSGAPVAGNAKPVQHPAPPPLLKVINPLELI